jgi:hypothetical protein
MQIYFLRWEFDSDIILNDAGKIIYNICNAPLFWFKTIIQTLNIEII